MLCCVFVFWNGWILPEFHRLCHLHWVLSHSTREAFLKSMKKIISHHNILTIRRQISVLFQWGVLYTLKRKYHFDEIFLTDSLEVVKLTTSSADSDEIVVIMTTFSFQCLCRFCCLLPVVLYSTLFCGNCSLWLMSYVHQGNHLHQDLLSLAANWHQSKEGISKCIADQVNIYIIQLWRPLYYNPVQILTV